MRPIPEVGPDFEQSARMALANAGWFARAGTYHFPLSQAQALELLTVGGEYSITAEQLADLADRGIISPPPDGLWSAGDVVQCGAVLEARRQWACSPSLHDAKRTASQCKVDQAISAGTLPDVLAGRRPALDVRHLLVLMTECDNREVREKLLAEVTAELLHTHGVRL